MPVQLAHFGEDIVHAMVCKLGQQFLALCRDCEDQKVTEPIAIKEATLDRYAGLAFDGASRIDMLLLLEGNRGLPFEIKLGSTRLSKGRIDDEWLRGCEKSHCETRWSGNMMSILERDFPEGTTREPLYANVRYGARADLQRVMLTPQWFIIARDRVIQSWGRPGARPNFSANVGFLSFESIVARHEGAGVPGQEFNALVRNLLKFDFYKRWIVGGDE